VLSPEQITKKSAIMVRPFKSRMSTSFAFLSKATFASLRAFSLLSKGLPSLPKK
jgi:hypothetical protein